MSNWRSLDPPGAAAMPWFILGGEGACADEDPELFFPQRGAGKARTDRAKECCRGCPVADECLSWALRTDQRAGIWGGATVEERDWMRSAVSGRTR